MASTHGVLRAFSRVGEGSRACRRLRRSGLVPGVLVGGRAGAKELVQFWAGDVEALLRLREGSFGNSLFRVERGEGGPDMLALPRNLQVEPLSRKVVSINFLAYNPEEGALVDLPVMLTDEEKCPGLKRGGVVNQTMHSVRCHVRGNKIPNSLHLSLAGLQVGEKATFKKNVELPPKTECEITLKVSPNLLRMDPDLTLLTIQGSRSTKDAARTGAAEGGGGGAAATEALDKF